MPSPLLTYSPLVSRQHGVAGAHLRIECADRSEIELHRSLLGWQSSWPCGARTMLLEFVNRGASPWPARWQPAANAMVIAAHARILDDPGYAGLGTAAPGICLASSDLQVDPPAGVTALAVDARQLPAVPPILAQRISVPWFALNADDPMDVVKARNTGAQLCGGWSCKAWKRKAVDRQQGPISTIFKILHLLDRDADSSQIEATLKSDAVLSYRLVALANTAALGFSVEVTSIKHAIAMLGRQRLRKWLSLLIIHSSGSETPPELLQAAFVRATFLEKIGANLELDCRQDDLFLCGAFSLLDKILGIGFADLLARISVSEEITDALLEHTGPLAPLLSLAAATEEADARKLERVCGELAIDNFNAGAALLAALDTAGDLAKL